MWDTALKFFILVLRITSPDHLGVLKKLRRLPQRERHNKKELCVRLSVLQLFHVGHFVQNKNFCLFSTIGFHVKTENKRFTAASVALSSEHEKFHVVIWQTTSKKLHQKACSTIIFPYSNNRIIDLWRCCCLCRPRHFLDSQLIELPNI